MVVIKAEKAIGSVLGLGTHTWLEIDHAGVKTTYSGSKGKGKILWVLRNYKRDYDRVAGHGTIELPAPEGVSEEQWARSIIDSAERVTQEMHDKYVFCGVFPWGMNWGLLSGAGTRGLPRANCCTVIQRIVNGAGGEIPAAKLKGFTPGLGN